MADFEKAYKKTSVNEGGYVNDPDDPGGETYRGVSRRYHPDWEGWKTVDKMKKFDGFPKNLDTDVTLQCLVKDFYREKFWNTVKGDSIHNQTIAESIYDFGVNAHYKNSIVLAQETLNIRADGIIGTVTIHAINTCDPIKFLKYFAMEKIGYYMAICRRRSKSRKYLYGWIKRAFEYVES